MKLVKDANGVPHAHCRKLTVPDKLTISLSGEKSKRVGGTYKRDGDLNGRAFYKKDPADDSEKADPVVLRWWAKHTKT
eukprot:UN05773